MFEWDKINRGTDGKVILLYRHQRILDEGIVKEGYKVLDLGGWGMLAIRLIEESVECIIMDNFSEDQYFTDRVKKLPHIVGDILHTGMLSGWGEGTYDIVTCFEMLEHCHNQELAANNIHKMLKQGGKVVGTFPIPGETHPIDDPSVSFLNATELLSLFTTAGFKDVTIETTGSTTKDEKHCSYYFTAVK